MHVLRLIEINDRTKDSRLNTWSFFIDIDLDDSAGSRRNTGPQISTLLGNRASDGRALHFTLGLYKTIRFLPVFCVLFTYVDNHTSVVLEVEENTVSAAPGLALTNNNSRHD